MDVLLALLHDRATLGAVTLRCAVIPNPRGSVSTVATGAGRVPYSTELVCRVAAAPTVGASVTVGATTGVVGAVSVFDTPGPWMRHARVYVTSRRDVTGPLPDEVTVYPSTSSTDVYGTVKRVPGVSGTVMDARIEPAASSEGHTDGQRRTQTWTVTTDGDLLALGVDAYSAVEHDGVRYAVVGDPLVHADPVGGHWSTATLRRVGDGTA
jgi:hypothetical protein